MRRGVEIGALALATAYVQSSAAAASPMLIQKTIALGAPGMLSHELTGLNVAEVAQMKLLTSAGLPLMSKIGLTIAAGLVITTGLWGMTHLAAFQNTDGDSEVTAVDAVAGDAAKSDETAVELSGRNAASDSAVKDVDSPAVEYGVIARDGSGMGFGLKDGARTAKTRRQLNKTTSEFSRLSASEVEQRLNELVHREKVRNLSFPGENPLTDILEQISNQISAPQDQRFTIIPDNRRLDEQSISLSEVMIEDIELDGISVNSALNIIMGQTDPALTWLAKDEVILITTAEEAEAYMFLRSYDISQLRAFVQITASELAPVRRQQNGGGGGFGGAGGGFFSLAPEPQFGGGVPSEPPAKRIFRTSASDKELTQGTNNQTIVSWEAGLIATIVDLTSPPCHWNDVDGEGGKLNVAGNRLIVRQSRTGHEQVVAVLEQLQMAADEAVSE